MEINKENVRNVRNKTKIPLPLPPLPPVPLKLIERNFVVREPLRTISQDDLQTAGPSKESVKGELENNENKVIEVQNKRNYPPIRPKHVTFREEYVLDWEYKVFKDEPVKEEPLKDKPVKNKPVKNKTVKDKTVKEENVPGVIVESADEEPWGEQVD